MSKIKEYFRKTLSIMLALAITTNNITSVNAEDDIFDTDCYLNHWGMSDIRSYLNALFDDENKINRIDSTKLSNNKYGYGRFFSNNEFSLIKPSTVQTNVLMEISYLLQRIYMKQLICSFFQVENLVKKL